MKKRLVKIIQVSFLFPIYWFLNYKGVNKAYWNRIILEFSKDFFNVTAISWQQKIWAYKNGFLLKK